jgi:Zn-dependent protease
MPEFTVQQLIMRFAAILTAVAVHEYAHAVVAYRFGDSGPKYDGRLTLNPFVHLDVLGTLTFWLFALGWSKPITVDPQFFRNPRRDLALVALAGPLSNIALATSLSLLRPLVFTHLPLSISGTALALFNTAITFNLWLAVFNILPVPPLDGATVLAALQPRLRTFFIKYVAYFKLALGLLIVFGLARPFMAPLHQVLSRLIPGS